MTHSSPPRPPSRKLLGLQYLRAIAAFGVVCFHAAGRNHVDLLVGEAGVDLFFVLSGFLMVAITDGGTSALGFIGDRLKRIVPVYWLATSVMLAGAIGGLFPSVRLTVGHVIGSYLFVPMRSPSNGMIWPLLVPGWTLNLEMFFYVLFALLLAVRIRTAWRVGALAALLGGLVLLGAVLPADDAIWQSYTNPLLIEFAAGAGLGLLWTHRAAWPARAGWPLVAAGMGLLVALLPHAWPRPLMFGVPAWLVVAGVLCLERTAAGVRRIVVLERAGDASYSIYLWHTLAISAVDKVGEHVGLDGGWRIGIDIVAGLGVGFAAYWLIERPILNAFKRRRYRHGAPVPAGV